MTIFCILTGYCGNLLRAQTGPGGVPGASLWLKADAGLNTATYFNVPAANRTASSTYNDASLTPAYSTLSSSSAWAASSAVANEYLTLDLGSIQSVSGVVTKGRGNYSQWVTSYTVSYSQDNMTYTPLGITFIGNTDQNTEVMNLFPSAVTARYIRITETAFSGHPCMRADIVKSLSTLSADNSAVSVWLDQSGSNNNMIQTNNAKRPTYYNNTASAVNFNPVITFNGSTNELTDAGGVLGTSTNSNAAAFVVSSVKAVQSSAVIYELAKNQSNADSHFGMNAPWSDNSIYWDGANNNRINAVWGGSLNVPYIWTGWNNASLSPKKTSLRRNGTEIVSGTTMNNYSGQNKPMYIGSTGGANYYNGSIGEVIIYKTALSAAERIRVESYLALKYGATLSSGYTLSDGTVVWDNAANSSYNNNIAGIGWDYDSGLIQKQSQSVNGGFQPVIGNGNIAATNAGNSNSFNEDGTFMVWGSDTGSTSFSTAFSYGGLNYRMARTWKVQKTKTIATMKIAVPVSLWPGAVTKPALLVGSTTAFDGTSIMPMTKENIGGTDYYTVTVDPASVQYFSFAGVVTAPGGVISGLQTWMKADNGVTVTSGAVSNWVDATGNGNNFSEPTNRPLYNSASNLVNFNPSISFNGSNQQLTNSTFIINQSAASVFAIAKFDNISSAWQTITASGNNQGTILRLAGSNIHYKRWIDNNNTTTTTGSKVFQSNNPYLLGLTTATGSNNEKIYIDGTLDVTGTTSVIPSATTFTSIGVKYVQAQGDYFGGTLPEIIYYSGSLGAIDRVKVESYLALKYGTTKSGDYSASDATSYWNATSNAAYSNNIAGIGRDDASALSQKQSRSVNSGIQPVIGNIAIADTNANNSNDFAADKTFMVWGSDTGSTNFATSFAFGGLNYRMARIWKVQETGTVGKVRVALKVSDLPGSITKPTLLVSGDTTFDGSDSTFLMTRETIGGVDYYVTAVNATIDFSSGQYFSFAGFVTAPGGVISSLGAWWKADYSASGTAWADASSNGRNASLAAGTITFKNGDATTNFNPQLTSDGGYMSYSNSIYPSGNNYDNMDIFAIGATYIREVLHCMGRDCE